MPIFFSVWLAAENCVEPSGTHNSARKHPDVDWRPDDPVGMEDLSALLAAGAPVSRNPASRFSFIRQDANSVLLFVDGRCFDCAGDSAAFAERICAQDQVRCDPGLVASAPAQALMLELLNAGSLAFDADDRGDAR